MYLTFIKLQFYLDNEVPRLKEQYVSPFIVVYVLIIAADIAVNKIKPVGGGLCGGDLQCIASQINQHTFHWLTESK